LSSQVKGQESKNKTETSKLVSMGTERTTVDNKVESIQFVGWFLNKFAIDADKTQDE
jgi:hypothetical protein